MTSTLADTTPNESQKGAPQGVRMQRVIEPLRVGILMSECVPGGGAEQFALETVRTLTSAGYQVTLYTQNRIDQNEFRRLYGESFPCRVSVRQFPMIPGTPRRYRTLFQELWFKSVHDDLLFDLSPGILPLYPRLPDLVYFHGPWLPQLSSLLRNEDTSYLQILWSTPYRLIVKAMLGRFFADNRITLLTNSKFTKHRLASIGLQVDVLYPPVDLDYWRPREDTERHGVASFARFSREYPFKRQEWQLEIMRDKDVDLLMMGTARSKQERKYLRFLQAKAQSNTKFLSNVDLNVARRNLWARKIFLFSGDSEPFGMTVVQAIAAGCLPLVYDGGGPREIVPFSELRFKTVEEAKLKLDSALRGQFDYLLEPLQREIKLFGLGRFRKNLLLKARRLK